MWNGSFFDAFLLRMKKFQTWFNSPSVISWRLDLLSILIQVVLSIFSFCTLYTHCRLCRR